MTLQRMFDASTPPAEPYPGCAAVAGYIGGNTPHVWTLAEWQRFGELRQLPIWVYGQGSTSAVGEGFTAADRAVKLGWKPDLPAGTLKHRRVIVLDMETDIDAPFVRGFAAEVHRQGFGCWVYGSKATVYSDPHVDGYWVALWDGKASLEALPDAVAHQFAAEVPWGGGAVDLSVVSGAGLAHLGRGPRRAA